MGRTIGKKTGQYMNLRGVRYAAIDNRKGRNCTSCAFTFSCVAHHVSCPQGNAVWVRIPPASLWGKIAYLFAKVGEELRKVVGRW